MNRAEVLALIDYILSVIDSADDKDQIYREVLKLRMKLQSGVWDEVLSKISH